MVKTNSFTLGTALAFGLAVAVVLAGSFRFYDSARQNAWHNAEAELQTIARFKTDGLAQWRAERLADASVIMDSAYLSEGIAAWVETKSPSEREKLINRLRSTAKEYLYHDALLVDTKGQVLLSVTGRRSGLNSAELQDLDTALREQRSVLGDLQPGDGDLSIYMAVIAPISTASAESSKTIGAVILLSDAEQYLYPLIQSWPVPSTSGETVFFTRDGEDVLFLSELRFQKDAALNLRVPLTRKEVPAVMAVLGKTGIMQGTDYRGVEVLSFLLAVPDSPWFLVVKQDAAEVFAPLRQALLATVAVVGLLILMLALALAFVWRQRAAEQVTSLLNETLEQRVRERTAELRQSEEQQRATFEQAAVGIAHVGLDGSWLRVNQRLCEIVGYSEKELRPLTFQDITYADDLDSDLAFVAKLLAGEIQTYSMEKRYIRKDGSPVWINLSASMVRKATGEPEHFIAVVENIDARKQAEEKAEQESQFSESVINSLPGVFYVISPGGRFRRWNTNFETVTGYSHDELLTLSPLDLFKGEDRQLIAESIQKTFKLGEVLVEAALVNKSGTSCPYLFTGVRAEIKGEPLLVGVGLDISERKRAEEASQASNERFKLLADTSPLAIYLSSGHEQKAQYINSTFVRLFGYTMEEVPSIDEWWPKAYPDEAYRQQVAEEWQRKVADAIAAGSEIEPMETLVACKDGTRKSIVWGFKTIGAENWAFGLDITERKQTEDTLHKSEARYRTIFEDAPVSIWEEDWGGLFSIVERLRDSGVVDFKRYFDEHPEVVAEALLAVKVLDVNAETVRLFKGKNKKDFLASLETVFATPDTLPGFVDELVALAEGKRVHQTEMRLCTVDKDIVFVLLKMIFPAPGSAAKTVFVSLMDITDQKRVEAELRLHRDNLEQLVRARTTELEAVNHELEAFSYSVSHDLKAPLRSVDGFAQMLEEDYADRLDDEGQRLLQVVRSSAREMGQLITDLLTFSRLSRKDLKLHQLRLSDLVQDVRSKLEQVSPGRDIRWEIGELPPAFCDEATIREVLFNLMSNAVKYTGPRQQAVISVQGRVEGNEAVYSVTDNGVGFDMAYKDKLFTVFQRLHTAKEFEGNGIGLALVQRIINRHGGRAWAEGKVDEGATFWFTLPVNKANEGRT